MNIRKKKVKYNYNPRKVWNIMNKLLLFLKHNLQFISSIHLVNIVNITTNVETFTEKLRQGKFI